MTPYERISILSIIPSVLNDAFVVQITSVTNKQTAAKQGKKNIDMDLCEVVPILRPGTAFGHLP